MYATEIYKYMSNNIGNIKNNKISALKTVSILLTVIVANYY